MCIRDRFIGKVELAGLDNFVTIEYTTRGEVEKYTYFRSDSVGANWEYDNLTSKFVNYDSVSMKQIAPKPVEYMDTLRSKIKSIGVEAISQTNWHGDVLKFWLNDAEYVTYVSPGFKFDSPDKVLFENELKSSNKIRDNWYYRKLKVCRNK
jgi:urate oxidase